VQTVYDGVAIFKTSKIRNPDKEEEQKRGIKEMLPEWSDKINRGNTVEHLHNWIMSVRDRQKIYISRFPSHSNSSRHMAEAWTKTAVDRIDQV